MNPNGHLLSKRVNFASMVAQVEKMILPLNSNNLIDGPKSLRVPNRRLIKATESVYSRLTLQRHSLLGIELGFKTLDQPKRLFPKSSNTKKGSQRDATGLVSAFLHWPHK